VDLVGIEPTTSSMPWKRAPSCATGPLGEGQLLYCLRSFPIRQTGSSQPQFPQLQRFTLHLAVTDRVLASPVCAIPPRDANHTL
jgi:hypothetical protein